jgi:hypothetical protein
VRVERIAVASHWVQADSLESFERRLFAETTFDGVGYGLGFVVRAGALCRDRGRDHAVYR